MSIAAISIDGIAPALSGCPLLFAVLIPALRLQNQVAGLLGFEADDEIGDVIMSIPVIADVRDGKAKTLIFDKRRGAGVVVEDVGRAGFPGAVGDDVVDVGVQQLADGFAGPEIDVFGGADGAGARHFLRSKILVRREVII